MDLSKTKNSTKNHPTITIRYNKPMPIRAKKKSKKILGLNRVLFFTIILLIIIRIAILPFSPPGFYIDEAATGAHVISMLQHGTNANGQAWPLFSSSLGGGYTTPVYLYPLTLWAMVFGASEVALRYFSELVTIIAVIFLGLSVRYWLGKRAALLTVIVGLALPWGWVQGSLAWDPAMVPLFVSLSFFAFSVMIFSPSRRAKIGAAILLPASLIALAYVYPPARVTAPLLYVMYYTLLLYRKSISIRAVILTVIGSSILLLPLLLFMLTPEALARSSALSIFYHTSLIEALLQFATNLFVLINPVFLFFVGDLNMRHSTIIQGMLGLASLPIALILIIYALKHRRVRFSPLSNRHLFVLVSVAGILFGLIGSALTAEGQPHSLRATAAWPFMAILIGLGWYILFRSRRRILQYTLTSVFIICTVAYVVDFVALYPTRAGESFDVSARHDLHLGKETNYPSTVLDYYTYINSH